MAIGEASNRIVKQEVFKRYGVHHRTLSNLYLGKVNIKIEMLIPTQIAHHSEIISPTYSEIISPTVPK